MYYPYWVIDEVPRSDGTTEIVAHNADSDTDMGDLYGDEFFRFLPHAFEITEEQFTKRTVDPMDAVGQAKWLREQREGN